MARTYALAAGALSVALVASLAPLALLPATTAATVVAAIGPRAWLPARGGRLALAAGAWLIAARIGLAAITGGPGPRAEPTEAADPSASAEVQGTVRSTIRLAGGRQDVLLDLDGGPLAYARLPRFPELVPADRIVLEGHVEELPTDPDPETVGWVGYLRRIDVSATVEARTVDRIGSGDGPGAWLARVRVAAGDVLGTVLPEPEAGLAAGILVGLRERVDPTLAGQFTASGLTHVVAISGWNIAIVGGVVGAVARPLPRRRRGIVIGLVIAAYTLVAGASPSVVRAALMAGVALLAREGGRRADAGRALALAVVAMLAVDPATVLDAGFQLSACATAGLLAWADGLGTRLERMLPAAPAFIRESLAVSLAAQAATLPVVLVDFGRVSLVSPAANLVVAPLVPFVMASAAAALPIGVLMAAGLPSIVLSVPIALAGLPLSLLAGTARVAAAVPYASVVLPPEVAVPIAGGCVAAILVLRARHGGPRATTGTAAVQR